MSVNRYTNLQYNSLNQGLPLIQLPFDQLDASLGQAQQQKNLFDKTSSLGVDYLQDNKEDVAAAKQITDYQNKLKTELAEIAKSGNTQKYLSALSQGSKNIASLYQSGGLANVLASRKASVAKSLQNLNNKQLKDDKYGGLNHSYDLQNFQNQYQNRALNYNQQNRTANSIGDAAITPYYDIKGELLKTVKSIDPSITEQDILSGGWIDRVKKKGVSPERIQQVFDTYISSPKARRQLGVESWNTVNSLDKSSTLENINNQRDSTNTRINETILELDNISNSNNKNDIKDLQSTLTKLGYNTKGVDGVAGKNTKLALNRYKEDLITSKVNRIQEDDESGYKNVIVNELGTDYENYYKSLFGQETSKTKKANPFSLQLSAARLRRKEKEKEDEMIFNTYKSNINNTGEYINPYENAEKSYTTKYKGTEFSKNAGFINTSKQEGSPASLNTEIQLKKLYSDLSKGEGIGKVKNTEQIWDIYKSNIINTAKDSNQAFSKIKAIDQQIHKVRGNNDYFIQRPADGNTLKKTAELSTNFILPQANKFVHLDATGKSNGDVMSRQDMFKLTGVTSMKDLKEKSNYVGKSHLLGGTKISGDIYSFDSPDGEIQFVAGNEPLEDTERYKTIREAGSMLYNPNINKSHTFSLDGVPTYTKIAYKYQGQVYDDQIASILQNISKLDSENQAKAYSEIDRLTKEQSNLSFGGKGDIIGMYPAYHNAETNDLLDPMDRGELYKYHVERELQNQK